MSKPSAGEVEQYIRDQKEHHKGMTFEAEYPAMLRRTGWEGDPEDAFR